MSVSLRILSFTPLSQPPAIPKARVIFHPALTRHSLDVENEYRRRHSASAHRVAFFRHLCYFFKIFYFSVGFLTKYFSDHKSKIKIRTFRPYFFILLFPLDRARRLRGHIETHAVDAFDLGDYPRDYLVEHFPVDMLYRSGHRVHGIYGADYDGPLE